MQVKSTLREVGVNTSMKKHVFSNARFSERHLIDQNKLKEEVILFLRRIKHECCIKEKIKETKYEDCKSKISFK